MESKDKVKKKQAIPSFAIVSIVAGFNNTLITIAGSDGRVICRGSTGVVGFKGARRSTPYAASIAADKVGKDAYALGVREVAVKLKGPGQGRISAVKSLRSAGLKISSITDVTPIPHNGCRPRKRRRG